MIQSLPFIAASFLHFFQCWDLILENILNGNTSKKIVNSRISRKTFQILRKVLKQHTGRREYVPTSPIPTASQTQKSADSVYFNSLLL